MFQWINEKYDSPLSVSSDVTIGEGKTVITFWGTGKSIETGEMEEINRDCVLEYELDAEVLHLEETPELVENVWDPKEKGQQGQAETIYDRRLCGIFPMWVLILSSDVRMTMTGQR